MSTVSTNVSTSRGVRSLTAAGLAAVVAALVLGILGMHALSQHGAAAHGTQPVATAVADYHASHPAPDHTPVATDQGSGPDMAMLCVAMLLTAAVGVLLALHLMRVVHRAPLSLLPAVRVATFRATARGGTGPPAVSEFSVVRC
jgi:hypothetical protein